MSTVERALSRYIDINKLMSREIYHIKIILVSYQSHVKKFLNFKGLIRVKFFLKCNPRRFLIISRFFDMENTMRLLKNSGRSIFFDVNPICQPVTGCARSRKIFFWIS